MASLTEWERQQLESMHLLLEQARTAIRELERKEKALQSGREFNFSQDWLKFRGVMMDLYSVLDYTYYLLYCHFSNKGQPDLSPKSTQFGFPSKPKGVKSSESPSQDQRKKFVEDKLQSLWGRKFGEESHFWKDIGDIILGVQPKLVVDNTGSAVGEGVPTISAGDECTVAFFP